MELCKRPIITAHHGLLELQGCHTCPSLVTLQNGEVVFEDHFVTHQQAVGPMLYQDVVNLLFQRPLLQKNVSCLKNSNRDENIKDPCLGSRKLVVFQPARRKSYHFSVLDVSNQIAKKKQHTACLSRLHQMLKYYTAKTWDLSSGITGVGLWFYMHSPCSSANLKMSMSADLKTHM